MNLKHVCNIHRILPLLFYIVYLSTVVLIGLRAAARPLPLTHDSFLSRVQLSRFLFTSRTLYTREGKIEAINGMKGRIMLLMCELNGK